MSLFYRLLGFSFITVLVAIATSTYLSVERRTNEFISGVDRQLLTGAIMAREIAGADYHDSIADNQSVSNEDYLDLVNRYNRICLQAGFQYLWSNLVLNDGRIVFTTATSISKDSSAGDFAGFFDTHDDPQAFQAVIASAETTFSTFNNVRGKARMVLMPYQDSHGRPYIFGASKSIGQLDDMMQRTVEDNAVLALIMFAVATLFSYLLSRPISRALHAFVGVANRIGSGESDVVMPVDSRDEFGLLARAFNEMATKLDTSSRKRLKIEHDLQLLNEELEPRVAERTQALHGGGQQMAHHIQNTPLGVVAWNENLECTQWSPQAVRVFGFGVDEVLGSKALHLIVPEALHNQFDEVFQTLMNQQGGNHCIQENITRDGSTILCEWFNAPLRGSDGEVKGVVSIVREITERV